VKLRRQLILVSSLLLTLPWAGCQYVQEMDKALRFAQQKSLTATVEAVSAALAQDVDNLYPQPQRLADLVANSTVRESEIFFHGIEFPISIDGYDDEWSSVPAVALSPDENSFYKSAIGQRQLHLFFHVTDADIIYHNPTLTPFENGDRIVLTLGNGRRYIMTSSAPGDLQVF